MDDERRHVLDINKDNLSRVIGFGPIYEGKAKFVLSLILALTAYLLTELPRYVTAHAKNPWGAWFVLLDIVCLVCFANFTYAAFLIVQTIRPNVTQHSQKPSPLFFQTIVQVPLEEFRNTITTLSADRAAELLAEQTYDNARIMAQKNRMVQRTTDWFVYGMICFLLFTIGQVILLAVLP